jgi:hypothetical protein
MLILAAIVLIISFIAFGFLPTLLIGGASVIGFREITNGSNGNGNSKTK